MPVRLRILVFSRTAAGLAAADPALRAAGFELVGQRGTLRDATEFAARTSPDLILAVLPHVGAAECAEQAHLLAADLSLPVVFLMGCPVDDGLVLPADWSDRFRAALRRESSARSSEDLGSPRGGRTQRLEGLGLLALGLAHDLNNILAPVLFVGPLLRASSSPEETARYVDSLEISAQRGASLVRQIMALAQGGSTVRRPATVRHIVRDALASLTPVLPRGIQVESLLPTDSWPAEINPTAIYQVTLNLALNACDAMPQGGTVRVELSNQLLPFGPSDREPARRHGPWLRLLVADTGTGIPAEVMARMWEPFYSTKPAGRGTGLGLPGVRGIVDEHGGFIEVRTREGAGSSFEVFLPARPDLAVPDQPVRRPPTPRGAGEWVLLVEDDAPLREMIGSVLEASGYRVIPCADGVEAIVQYNAHAAEIALVLTDITMPNLNGSVLTRTLRKLDPHLPILILTGLSDDPPVERELADARAVASDYVHKSVPPESLLERVRVLVESRRRA